MKRYINLIAFIMFLGFFSNAQIVTIVDALSKAPIENATLHSGSFDLILFSDENGSVEINQLKNENNITIRALGFKTVVTDYNSIVQSRYKVEMDRSGNKLDEVLVSATKTRQPFRKLSTRITRINTSDLYLQNPQTAADLLSISGEVFIQKSQLGGGSPMIRGFSANRLLYTVDGIRMNNAIFRSGNLHNVISLDGLAMENIEVLFGPGSIIYGSDAIGGVMSFQTIAPRISTNHKLNINTNALIRYSSANREKTAHLDVNYGTSKWAGVTSLTWSDFDDLRMGSKGPEEYLRHFYVDRIENKDSIVSNPDPKIQRPSGYSQWNVMQKIRFRPNTHWDINYGFHLSETSEFARYDRLIETVNGVPRSAVWNYGPQKWNMHVISVQYSSVNKAFDSAILRLSLQNLEESRIDRNYSGGQRFRLRTQKEEVKAYSVNLDFEKKLDKHSLIYGAEYVYNDVHSAGTALDIRNNNPINVPDRYPASNWTSAAAYATLLLKLSEKLDLNTGIRYNTFRVRSDFTRHLSFFPFDFTSSELNNKAITGSMGMVIRPEDDFKLSFLASSGFRAPNVDDIGKIFDFGAREVVVPNASLKAEYAYNTEISIFKQFGNRLSVDFSAYYTYLNNAMVRRAFQVAGKDSILYNGNMSKVFAIQNAAFGEVYGFQVGVEIKFTDAIKLKSQYNYQIGREEMDNQQTGRSRHAAPSFGITRLTYQSGKITAEVYAQYSGEVSFENLNEEERQKPAIYAKNQDGKPYSPAWYTVNIKAGYLVTKQLQIFTGLENFTDQRYRPYSSGIVAPGINAIVSLRLSL